MNNPAIPAEAVEAAALEMCAADYPNYEPDLDLAHKVLEAAAPHIRAQALEDAADAIKRDGDPRDVLTVNWLKARAGAERSHAV